MKRNKQLLLCEAPKRYIHGGRYKWFVHKFPHTSHISHKIHAESRKFNNKRTKKFSLEENAQKAFLERRGSRRESVRKGFGAGRWQFPPLDKTSDVRHYTCIARGEKPTSKKLTISEYLYTKPLVQRFFGSFISRASENIKKGLTTYGIESERNGRNNATQKCDINGVTRSRRTADGQGG